MATGAARRLTADGRATPRASSRSSCSRRRRASICAGRSRRRRRSATRTRCIRAVAAFWDRDRAFAPDLAAHARARRGGRLHALRAGRDDTVTRRRIRATIAPRRTPCAATTSQRSEPHRPERASRSARSARRAARALSAKIWLTEAPLRMLMNNLDPEVAENPHRARRLRRHRPRRAQLGMLRRDRRGAARARRRRVAADPVGQAGRRVQDASRTRRAC